MGQTALPFLCGWHRVHQRWHGIPLKVFLPIWEGAFQIATYGRGRRTFGGKIADVKLYSKALNVSEINQLLQQEKGQF